MESTKEYLKLFNACPIKIGDTVRVLRGWKDVEYGWYEGNLNCSIKFSCLGVDYVVTDKYKDYYEIENEDDTWYVPFFVLEVVKSAPVDTATSDDYLAFHKASGLKIGDTVKVTRKAEDYEMGWKDIWASYMDDYVGHTYKITGDGDFYGWKLDNKCTFPTFVLQKIDEPTKKEVVAKPTTNKIVVKENSVVINGNELTKEQIGALYYKLVRKGKKSGGVKNKVKYKAHNPDNLTPKQVGVSEGYRLLDEDEIKERKLEYKEIEAWVCSCWSKEEFVGGSNVMTYRTKLSREQLARLK